MRHHLHALLLAAQVSGVLKSEHVCPLGRQNGESSPTRTHCVPPGHVLHWRATQVLLPAHHPHPGLDAQDEQSDSDSATAIPSLHETKVHCAAESQLHNGGQQHSGAQNVPQSCIMTQDEHAPLSHGSPSATATHVCFSAHHPQPCISDPSATHAARVVYWLHCDATHMSAGPYRSTAMQVAGQSGATHGVLSTELPMHFSVDRHQPHAGPAAAHELQSVW